MSLGHIIKVRPSEIRFTLLGAGEETSGILSGDYDLKRGPLDDDIKHRSMRQRYVKGYRWQDTDIFRDVYKRRFAASGTVRGTHSLEELLFQYHNRVDAMFADMKKNGFRLEVDGRPVPLPNLHIGHDGELLAGNNGNHRLAIARILGLGSIYCRIQSMHEQAPKIRYKAGSNVTSEIVPPVADAIPAMTTLAERQAYYRLAREAAPLGAVLELGAWLGASTVYLAAGVRDSGADQKVHTFDRWAWDPSHERKVKDWRKAHPNDGYVDGPMPNAATMFEAFEANLGDLKPFVIPHPGEIAAEKWKGGPISLMVLDAPKRVKTIVKVLERYGPHLNVGARMAWQDFAHFPSYEIVACLHRMQDFVTFDYGVAPGTTTVFTVKAPWSEVSISEDSLALANWKPEEVISAWDEWSGRLPAHMRARFRCGAALFLCDLGRVKDAQALLRSIVETNSAEVLPKWNYLRAQRGNLASRYSALLSVLPS